MRPREAGRERGEREQRERGRQVTEPARAAADQVRQQRRGREERPSRPPALEEHVATTASGTRSRAAERPLESHRRARAGAGVGKRPQPVALGREHDVRRAQRGQPRRPRRARGRGGRRSARAGARSRCRPGAAARSRDRRAAARRRSAALLARVADLDRDTSWRPASGAAACASRAARGSRRRRRRASAAGEPGDSRAVAERGPPPPRARLAPSASSRPSIPARPWRGGTAFRSRRRTRRCRGGCRAGSRRGRRQARRPPRRRPCAGRRCRTTSTPTVEREPGDQHALGQFDADVRLAGPRGHVPVDPADVVAGQVRAHLRELAAVPSSAER